MRTPDPTLRTRRSRSRSPVEGTRAGQLPEQNQVDAPTKPKRQRVVLAERGHQKTGLRPQVELAQQTSWGEMLIKDLISVQFRLAVVIGLIVAVLLGGLPLAFVLAPGFAELTVGTVPLAWLLLGLVPFPLLFGAGMLYNRIAERQERTFVDMIES
ncbi:hypothetical protein [Haloechinothrix sp. LS1_15]|uniref:hypothetical protein n=1 Tax=Haloechinothrix sp. LS1_15 TaxID=2652248 RepID=UPI0029448C70|nr:hypothetical protein [Haloechinothrix sp. LS1_15]MDV6014539.1 DUF485 domain-containing protein [Haloechinothrix sp. LS1_15]